MTQNYGYLFLCFILIGSYPSKILSMEKEKQKQCCRTTHDTHIYTKQTSVSRTDQTIQKMHALVCNSINVTALAKIVIEYVCPTACCIPLDWHHSKEHMTKHLIQTPYTLTPRISPTQIMYEEFAISVSTFSALVLEHMRAIPHADDIPQTITTYERTNQLTTAHVWQNECYMYRKISTFCILAHSNPSSPTNISPNKAIMCAYKAIYNHANRTLIMHRIREAGEYPNPILI